jgi:hypothetical protein
MTAVDVGGPKRGGPSAGPATLFGIEIGEYRGVVRVPRPVFQRLLPDWPTFEKCDEAYYHQGPGSRVSPSENFAGAS